MNEPPLFSLTRVRSILRERGVPEEDVAAMSREDLRIEQAKLQKQAALERDALAANINSAPPYTERSSGARAEELRHRLKRKGLHFAALRQRQFYRYMVVALVGIVIGALITLSMKPRTTYSDCILSHIDHASSQMAVYVTEHACAAKYPPAPGESAE